MTEITEPGVYQLDVADYHADPVPGGSLSQTGARRLLPPSCPALYRWWADNPAPPKKEFDLGHAAHRLVLGVGPDLEVVDAADWRTRAAREQRDEAYAAGRVPVLTETHEQVLAMADALRAHPVAGYLFEPGTGVAEEALFWRDEQTGIMRRALLDWRPHRVDGQRTILADYKTTKSASPAALERAIYDYGYYIQGPWYLDGARALGLVDPDASAFVLVCQEKDPPYLVNVVEPDAVAMRAGRLDARRAINLYAECQETGQWPGYSDGVELVSLPPYIERLYQEV